MSKQAKGQKGFLLYNPFEKKYFFRVYESEDKKQFTDYKLCAEDIEIEVIDKHLELYKGDENRLDYSRKTLGKL